MGAGKVNKKWQKQVAETREKMFAASRENRRGEIVAKIIRLRKREQESELKKWFVDTFDVGIGEEDEED